MSPWQGVLYPVFNRIIQEDEDIGIPEPILQAVQEEVEHIDHLLDGVDIENPATYSTFLSRMLEEQLSEESRWDNAKDVIEGMGLQEVDIPAGFVQMLEGGEVFFNREDDYVYNPISGVYLVISGEKKDIYVTDGEKRERALSWARETIWSYRDSFELEIVESPAGYFPALSPYDVGETPYIGPLEDLKERSIKMWEKGHRWCVLLQGKPGIGKTTFCRDVARQIGKRVLFVGKDTFSSCTSTQWGRVLDVLRPSVLILDDIDHLRESKLKRHISAMDERRTPSSLILMTSNNLENFPDPMKRPGRIDHIVEVESPSEDVLNEMIMTHANEFNIDPPDSIDKLRQIYLERSPAHLREVFRRAAAWGWNDDMIWSLYEE